MSKKLNNRGLLAILLGLALIFILINYLKKHNNKASFNDNIVSIDTAQISKITIKKNSKKNVITFLKTSENWEVSQGNIKSQTKKGTINNILNTLKKLKPEQLVAKTKNKWDSYQLTDSLATKVVIEELLAKTTTLYLGKTKHTKPANQYNRYGTSNTYIRVNENPETYTVKGTLSGTFNRDFNFWRNSDILKTDKNSITQVQFDYPEYDFILSKRDSIWSIEDQIADATKVTQYLNTLSYKTSLKFADTYFKTKPTADYQLTIRGNNINDITIKAYADSISNKFYLKSSYNDEAFFESDSTGIFKQLFVSKENLLMNNK